MAQNWAKIREMVKGMITSDNVQKAVSAFVNAQTWEKRKRLVEERQNVLLTDAAEEALADLLTQYKDDKYATAVLEEYREVLGRCREIGIDAAFADRLLSAPDEMPRRIAAIREALTLIDRSDQPEWWASFHVNLGHSLQVNLQGDVIQNIEEAISHYEQALEVFTKEDLPWKWAVTRELLAFAYSDRILGDVAQNIEESISYYEQALEVFTWEDFPEQWTRTHNNLAVAYLERIREEKDENLKDAISRLKEVISRCEQALEVFTREDFPVQWALTHHNLASAYYERMRGERDEKDENLEKAISHCEQALEVRTPNRLPEDCRLTARNLGGLLYTEGRFAEARVALTTAHEAVEALRSELQREGAKRELAEQNAVLYARLVHCCLIEDDEETAFEYAVAGKGRAFVDILATARFDLFAAGEDDPQLAEDLRQARELRQQIDNLLARRGGEDGISPDDDGEERGTVRIQMKASLQSLQEQEAAHWKEMSFKYPALTATQQAPTLSAEDARALARELEATLVEYYRHAGGWCAFVVSPEEIRRISLPGVDEIAEDILEWLQDVESPYGRNEWSYDSLRGLHEAVIAPLGDHLPPGGAVVLAPFSWLHLVPLSAALDPKTGRYAADDHLLGFTPNLAALRVALDQESRQDDSAGEKGYRKLLDVAYPGAPGSDHYLPNVLPEAEAVARHFPEVTPLYQEAATPNAVVSRVRGQDVVHFGCHGTFDPEAPEQSGLMLSGGWLTVQRIITELHIDRTKLATIGACLSGRVHVRQAEEHVGLVQAVMSAGARAVVASLWPVNDAATRALFEAFYAGIEAGKSPAVALSDAARMVRERDGWEHPYYWAAFQPVGLAHEAQHEGDEPDSARLRDEVDARVEEARKESNDAMDSVRGGFQMDKKQVVADSMSFLRQMKRRAAKMHTLVEDSGEREDVEGRLHDLEEQASSVQTERELLEFVDKVFLLVEETTTLRKGLLPKEMDVEAARQQRHGIFEDPTPEDVHAQVTAVQMGNDVREILQEFEQSSPEEDPQ